MKHDEIDIRLLELREDKQHTRLYRWELVRYDGAPVDVELSTDFKANTGKGTVTVRLGAHYTTMRTQMRRRLLDYVMEAEYGVTDADGLIDVADNEVLVTTDFLRLMLSIALGAMRGMIALRTEGTFLSKYPLPIYNLGTLLDNIVNSGTPAASR